MCKCPSLFQSRGANHMEETHMADTSLTIFDALSKELRCDDKGRGFSSLRGLARMCGVSHKTWGQSGSLWTLEIDEYLAECGIEVRVWDKDLGVPDTPSINDYWVLRRRETEPDSQKIQQSVPSLRTSQSYTRYCGLQASDQAEVNC